MDISNTAQVKGYGTLISTDTAEYEIKDTSGSGSSEISYLTVLKQDADTKDPLNGAQFALYGPYDATKNKTPADASIAATITAAGQTLYFYGCFTSGVGGKLEGTFLLDDNLYLSDNGVYTLVETKAPNNYSLAAPYTFCWDATTAETSLPIYTDGGTITIQDKSSSGGLEVTKTVSGNASSADKEFSFTVTLSNTSINGTYGEMTFTNGVATFTLKGGETKKADNLPNGTQYTVTEADYSSEGYVTTKTGETGTIVSGSTQTAAFTNTKDVSYGALMITKRVTGDLGDKNKYFTFVVTFDPDGTFAYTGSHSGTIASGGMVALKHGEYVTITGIPAGTSYTVYESNNTGYTVYSTGTIGVISANQTAAAQFTNARSTWVITGDNFNLILWSSLAAISVIGMTSVALLLKHRKKHNG